MTRIERSGRYERMLEGLCREDRSLLEYVEQRLLWFRNNPSDTRLDNHPLTKTMEGYWAFFITDDIRVIYEWIGKTTVRFLAIGRHETVYKKSS